jgi:hypothetical protein
MLYYDEVKSCIIISMIKMHKEHILIYIFKYRNNNTLLFFFNFYFQNDHDLMMAFKGNVRTYWLISKEGFAPLDSDHSVQDLAEPEKV